MDRLQEAVRGKRAQSAAAQACAAAFATVALGFLAFQAGLATARPADPSIADHRPPALPSLGTRLSVPPGTVAVLALPSCDWCSLRSLPSAAVRAATAEGRLLILDLDDKQRSELSGARATVWQAARAASLGQWIHGGPVLVELSQDRTVKAVASEPAKVVRILEARYGGGQR